MLSLFGSVGFQLDEATVQAYHLSSSRPYLHNFRRASRNWYDALSVPEKTPHTRVKDGEWGSSSSRVGPWYHLLLSRKSMRAFSGASVSLSGLILSSSTTRSMRCLSAAFRVHLFTPPAPIGADDDMVTQLGETLGKMVIRTKRKQCYHQQGRAHPREINTGVCICRR